MAVYTTPTETHEHYIERDSGGSGAGVWAVVVVLIVLFAILFFGTNVFGRRGNSNGTNINGTIQTPTPTPTSGGSYTPTTQ